MHRCFKTGGAGHHAADTCGRGQTRGHGWQPQSAWFHREAGSRGHRESRERTKRQLSEYRSTFLLTTTKKTQLELEEARSIRSGAIRTRF